MSTRTIFPGMWGDDDGVCCCCRFIVTLCFAAFFMWLSLRTSNPRCYIQDFYLPALDKSGNSTAIRNNNSIYFDVKLQNRMKDKGVHYDAVNLTFFYGSEASVPVANVTVPSFYQGHGKNARKKGKMEAHGAQWRSGVNGNRTSFRLILTTRVKFKILFWYTKRHDYVVGGNVEINDLGKKASKKGVRLKSGGVGRRHNGEWLQLVVAFSLLFFLLYIF